MTSDSERRRLLEELQAALEMVRAGCESGLRALAVLRAASAEEAADGAGPAVPGPAPAPPVRARMPAGRWVDDLDAAMSRLPEVFTKADLVRELEYQPTRGTLLRIIDHLSGGYGQGPPGELWRDADDVSESGRGVGHLAPGRPHLDPPSAGHEG